MLKNKVMDFFRNNVDTIKTLSSITTIGTVGGGICWKGFQTYYTMRENQRQMNDRITHLEDKINNLSDKIDTNIKYNNKLITLIKNDTLRDRQIINDNMREIRSLLSQK
jgi:hypothetical protein